MTEMVPSGLMRGRWRRSDGPLEGDTRPKWGETAGPRTPWTPPRQCPTPLVILCKERPAAEAALEVTEDLLREMSLSLDPEKTQITHFDRGFRYLGHLFVRSF